MINTTKDKWSQLSMQQRADLIKLYIESGVTDIKIMKKDYNGVPYASFNSSEYDYFGAAPENIPSNKEEHWTSRNPHTGQLLKRDDHPTYDLMLEGEKEAGYNIYKGLDGNLYSKPKNSSNYVEYKNGGRILDGTSEENQTLDNEPIYYDFIEPSVVKAFKSNEDYNRFLGEKGARTVRKGTNKAANVIGEILRYTPIIGDAMDGVEAYEEAKNGNLTKAGVLAGIALLPNALEKPLKAVGKGVKNLRLYNKYTKDGERFRDAVEYAIDKYSKRADMINDSYGGNDRKRVVNSASDLKSTAYNQPISTDFRIQSLFPKIGGAYNTKTDEIWLNRYRPRLIKKAWDSPKEAIKLIKDTAAHEGTHLALDHIGDALTVKGSKYPVANQNHPLYDRVGYAFSDPDRVSSVWAINPEEFVANMTKVGYHLNIDPRLNVKNWSDSHKDRLAKFLSSNHYFTTEDALFMAEELSDFGYKNGGLLLTKR